MNDWGKDYLAHHGIIGMKWGVRRYQNEDGSLTTAGQKRYAKEQYRQAKKEANKAYSEKTKAADAARNEKLAGHRESLATIDADYERKVANIDSYFQKQVNKIQARMDENQQEADFWGEDSPLSASYREAIEQDSFKLSEINGRWYNAKADAKRERDRARSEVDTAYAQTLAQANAEAQEAYFKAADEFYRDLAKAKSEYKAAKKKGRG